MECSGSRFISVKIGMEQCNKKNVQFCWNLYRGTARGSCGCGKDLQSVQKGSTCFDAFSKKK